MGSVGLRRRPGLKSLEKKQKVTKKKIGRSQKKNKKTNNGHCGERLDEPSNAATGLVRELFIMLIYHVPAGVNDWGYCMSGVRQDSYYQVDAAQAAANLNLGRVKAWTTELVRTSTAARMLSPFNIR